MRREPISGEIVSRVPTVAYRPRLGYSAVMNRIWALLLLPLLMLAAAGQAQPSEAGGQRMTVALRGETATVLPGGTVTIAFVMHPRPGWHGYWRNPGDAGAEPRVRWGLPPGWSAGPLQYPVPDRLLVAGLMNYVYERDYALLATISVPATAEPGVSFPVDARLDYLVCTSELCVPETATVSLELATATPGPADPAFAGYRRALPRALSSAARFEVADGRVRIAIPLPASTEITHPYFFAGTLEAVGHSAPQNVSRSGDLLIVEAAAGPRAATLTSLEGLIEIGPGAGLAFEASRGTVPAAGTPIAGPPAPVATAAPEEAPETAAPTAEGPGLWVALLGAFLGGLLLNVMPCVFPILSLKALSLARAGETEAAARREALAYSAGVVGVCLALGGLLLALRASGTMVGWAFQLQDPRVILFLLLLVSAITLNLAGLFRLPSFGGGDALANSGGTRGALFTGALAAFVATPCTGPFMGAALGAALVLPTLGALAIFAGLGLGLALPFLLLGFVPGLRQRLPRPGPWMVTFQRVLAVPMALTALGLAWILDRQTGTPGLALGLGATGLAGVALWWLGRRQATGGVALPLALLAATAAVALVAVRPEPQSEQTFSGPLQAERFSAARLAQLRAEGTPVFVYFTADWCLTCKVNERGAMDSADVAAAFAQRGIRVLAGDWTLGDAEIGRFLEAQGRSGVPLYLYYAPGREAETLPQILTVGALTGLGA
jgi:thiol:disulfide interchange protein/DsbC/DsbD-like thiol-disulfide interchange protein